ncbi:Kynureninase [Lecanosticta acicola]|uniref:Kynureninase n=1 Tax=Lecanosticta acicola TaxID=111012 RepID=A0AAI8YV71_9PEZI|nr:Kynureninase [Lecanosticta acicola]
MDHEVIFQESHAHALDHADPLREFRDAFLIPSPAQLASTSNNVNVNVNGSGSDEKAVYLCGNSLGLQPTLTRKYFEQYLDTWAQKGVFGHFKPVSNTHLAPWLHVDEDVRDEMAKIVGARAGEVAVMQTLTANLHFLMCSFYLPSKQRHKILLEGRAFPSDHFAVESQIRFHGFNPENSMVLLEPAPEEDGLTLSTAHTLSRIDQHADELALVLLPGIQYYTGQFFDIKTITAHAQSKGIVVGWDLAHAAGNVPLELHDWNVDFAAWCTYKYLNAGPGSIGGCFVHERHGRVLVKEQDGKPSSSFDYRPRLAGWWGSQKSSRFAMANNFEPIPGAAGFQLSNTSVADSTAVKASLDVFKQTSMRAIREKSLQITSYLERLLDLLAAEQKQRFGAPLFHIITPRNPAERGAQLSVKLRAGLLDAIMETLEHHGVVVDERRPDVVRVAPAPLYNSFADVRTFIAVFRIACTDATKGVGGSEEEARIT